MKNEVFEKENEQTNKKKKYESFGWSDVVVPFRNPF